MGLLDQFKGPLLDEVMGLIKNQGGLSGLAEKLKNSGLADQVSSWIGTGANQPVDAGQISNALGSDTIGQIAGKLGVSHEEAAEKLSTHLPEIVNQMTPNGKIEADDLIGKGIDALKKLF